MKSSPEMDYSQNPGLQACKVKSRKLEGQPDSSIKTNAPINFTVGDWDQFDDIWEGEDDTSIPTEEIHNSPSPSLHPYLPVHIVESSEDEDDREELEDPGSQPKSYQPGSLAPQLDVTSLSDSDSDSTPSESESGYETDSSDESSSTLQERDILSAQRYLALRAIYPQRRTKLEPRRKTIVFQPTPLSIRKPATTHEHSESGKHCPDCDNTVYRMVSELCLLCVMGSTRTTIQELESAQECYDDEYFKQIRRISDRKCAIEEERPEDYEEDGEYRGLMKEFLVRREKAMERTAKVNGQIRELEAQIRRYEVWMDEDLAKLKHSKNEAEMPAFL